MDMTHLELRSTNGRDAEIFLDGEEITEKYSIRNIELRMGVDDLPTLKIELALGSVEISAQVVMDLVAELVDQEYLTIVYPDDPELEENQE